MGVGGGGGGGGGGRRRRRGRDPAARNPDVAVRLPVPAPGLPAVTHALALPVAAGPHVAAAAPFVVAGDPDPAAAAADPLDQRRRRRLRRIHHRGRRRRRSRDHGRRRWRRRRGRRRRRSRRALPALRDDANVRGRGLQRHARRSGRWWKSCCSESELNRENEHGRHCSPFWQVFGPARARDHSRLGRKSRARGAPPRQSRGATTRHQPAATIPSIVCQSLATDCQVGRAVTR